MAFTNTITVYNTQTLNHCDVFNEVNMILLQNTLWNKKLIESLNLTVEQNEQKLNQTSQDVTNLIKLVDTIPSNAKQNQLFFKKV